MDISPYTKYVRSMNMAKDVLLRSIGFLSPLKVAARAEINFTPRRSRGHIFLCVMQKI